MASALESPQFGSATNRWSGLLQDSNWEIIQAAVHRYRRPSIVFVGWFNYGFHRRFCTHNFCSADNFNRVSTCRFPGSRTFSPQSCCGDRDRCQVRTVNFQEAGTFSLDPGAIQYVALINFNIFRISLGFPEENLSGEWKFFFFAVLRCGERKFTSASCPREFCFVFHSETGPPGPIWRAIFVVFSRPVWVEYFYKLLNYTLNFANVKVLCAERCVPGSSFFFSLFLRYEF